MTATQYIPPRYRPSGLPGDPTLAEWTAQGNDPEQWQAAFGGASATPASVVAQPEIPAVKPSQMVGQAPQGRPPPQAPTVPVVTPPAAIPMAGSTKAFIAVCLLGAVGLAGYALTHSDGARRR